MAVAASAAAETLRVEFWLTKDPVGLTAPGGNAREPGELTERERQAFERLIEDARWTFSGMIYGFDVRWTPSSRSRDVEEELSIIPHAMIPENDPRMSVAAIVEDGNLVYISVDYRVDETQARRVSGWKGESLPKASGGGSASVFLPDSRRGAMEDAIKETIRAWLRAREYNRPREVSGRVAFVSAPEISYSAGQVRADITLSMDLKPLREYRID